MNNKNAKLRLKNITQLFLGIIPIFILVITFSCENESSSLGEELLPDSDKIQYHFDSSLTFSGSVFKKEAFNTSNTQYYSLGIIEDDYFGVFKGEYLGQFLPYSYDSTILVSDVDSVVLYLAIDSTYGNPKGSISFEAFELTSEIEEDDSYMSNTDISTFFNASNSISDWSSISGDTLVRVSLTNDFIDKLISIQDSIVQDSIYRNSEYFKSVFNGIAIIPSSTMAPGGTIFTNLSSSDSKIVLYYNDSVEFNYSLSTGHGFAKYTTDYSTSIINDYLTNPENENDDLLFLQGANGVSSKITFSNIEPWILEDSSYSIMSAELIVPVYKDDEFDLFFPPEKLSMQYSDADSTLFYIDDYSGGFFDGVYNSSENNYHFNISKHLMKVLSEDITDSCLNFNIVNSTYFPFRVILESSENIKLNVTYTKH